jgi:hypothetical protein
MSIMAFAMVLKLVFRAPEEAGILAVNPWARIET